MKMKILLSTTLLLLSGLFLIAVAQDAELSLYYKIVAAIEKGEPEWKLNRKAIMPSQVVIRWASERGRALISVSIFASEAESKETLNSRVNEWEHRPESKVSKTELKNVGDEGYILKYEGVSGAQIFFRKGIYEVEVFGPSEDTARRFAHHISDLLPTSNNSFNRSAG